MAVMMDPASEEDLAGGEGLGEERRETELERCDRNLVELLQEVRVAQTGVQVLFGFLLALSFTPRFRHMSSFQRIDYFATLMASGAAAVFLIAPTAYHRILFRLGDKEHLVQVANRFMMIGLAAVAVAMVGVVLLVTDAMFTTAPAIIVTTLAAGGCATTWFLMPLWRRRTIARAGSGVANAGSGVANAGSGVANAGSSADATRRPGGP